MHTQLQRQMNNKTAIEIKITLGSILYIQRKMQHKIWKSKKTTQKKFAKQPKNVILAQKKTDAKSTRQNKNKTKRTTQQQKKNNLY